MKREIDADPIDTIIGAGRIFFKRLPSEFFANCVLIILRRHAI